jgi:hypothetical protein
MSFVILLVCLFLAVLSLAAAILCKDENFRELMGWGWRP